MGTRRLDKTVVRLADCTSVTPAPAESGPRAGTAAFRLETSGRSYLLAAEQQQSEEWVAKLCEIAFPVSGAGDAGGIFASRRRSPEGAASRRRGRAGGASRSGGSSSCPGWACGTAGLLSTLSPGVPARALCSVMSALLLCCCTEPCSPLADTWRGLGEGWGCFHGSQLPLPFLQRQKLNPEHGVAPRSGTHQAPGKHQQLWGQSSPSPSLGVTPQCQHQCWSVAQPSPGQAVSCLLHRCGGSSQGSGACMYVRLYGSTRVVPACLVPRVPSAAFGVGGFFTAGQCLPDSGYGCRAGLPCRTSLQLSVTGPAQRHWCGTWNHSMSVALCHADGVAAFVLGRAPESQLGAHHPPSVRWEQ